MLKRSSSVLLLLPAGLLFTAFARTSSEPAAPSQPSPNAVALATAPAEIRLTVAPSGNEVRYRVREQLVGRDLPNDAVGETTAVTGAIVFDDAGRIVRDQSRVVVNVTGLTSDSDRRDGYVQRRLLEGEQHPTVTFVPTEVHGLSGAIPASGTANFHVVGDLTVKGVTRPAAWEVTASFNGGQITGSASTAFTFEDFGLTQPSVSVLLSVADTIKLEYDFTLQRESSTE